MTMDRQQLGTLVGCLQRQARHYASLKSGCNITADECENIAQTSEQAAAAILEWLGSIAGSNATGYGQGAFGQAQD